MTFEAAIIVSSVMLVVTLIVLMVVFASRRRAARHEDLKRQASMRGWSFEASRQGRYRVQRWRATTDGVEWMAESLERPGGQEHRAVHISRWRTTGGRGPSAPIVCIGVKVGKETPSFKIAQGDGMFAHLAHKVAGFALDKGIDSHFGEEIGRDVDATTLKQVPNTVIPGYVVMAADVDAAARVLFQGLTNALTMAAREPQSPLGNDQRPWVLLWKGGVSLGRLEEFGTTEEVEKFARAGVTLARLPIV